MPFLVLKENYKMFWRLPEPPAPFTIGRVADNDLAILDPQVSRRHARLEPQGTGWQLIDLGSANGSFLNGKQVEKALLASGDEIRFGKTVFIFQTEMPQVDDDTD